jgi:cell fate regulator YaaT (PSP1 superfamily)
MHIVTAEFQFDRSKLFIHYAANSRVDFRELIKNVFGVFKTCIWFKKLSRRVFEPKPFALMALRTGAM